MDDCSGFFTSLLHEVPSAGAELGAGVSGLGGGGQFYSDLAELSGFAGGGLVGQAVTGADSFDNLGEDLVDSVGLQGVSSGFVGNFEDVRRREVGVGVLALRAVRAAALADYDRVQYRVGRVKFSESGFVGGLIIET